MTMAKHHTNYRCEQEIERLQIYSGSMAHAEYWQGSIFYGSKRSNAKSDWFLPFHLGLSRKQSHPVTLTVFLSIDKVESQLTTWILVR
jgi:hypothetical protein